MRVVQASPTVCELRHIERPSVCGDWKYHTSNDLDELIVSIDRRTENARMESSLIGVWFQSAIDSQLSSEEPLLIVPIYNTEKTAANDIYESFGLHLVHPMVPNFLPATLDITPYLEAHKEYSEALLRKNGLQPCNDYADHLGL